jgi:hypothetical protein
MKHPAWFGLPFIVLCIGNASTAAEFTPEARELAAVIDSMDVERHWPAGTHIDWETGLPDGKPGSAGGKHTHCSAFVASVAKRLGIYILRPPEHGQTLLANAQYDWLANEGPRRGWQRLGGDAEAQDYANRGYFVVATYKNHHDEKPGHIAIVRPDAAKSASELRAEGPQITQAGGTNYRSTTLKQGFADHPAAWGLHEVRYYAHSVDAPIGDPSVWAR